MALAGRISPVHIGTAFEAHSLRFLNHHLNMSLRRIGGPGDDGVDLSGWWYVPSNAKRFEKQKNPSGASSISSQMEEEATALPSEFTAGFEGIGSVQPEFGMIGLRRVKVVAQCKAESKKLSARAVRELEGVMGHMHGAFGSSHLYLSNLYYGHLCPDKAASMHRVLCLLFPLYSSFHLMLFRMRPYLCSS